MEKGEDKEEYIELQKLLDFPEDITEITPPKSAVNWKQLAQDYARSVVPHIITWLPKYNLQKLRGDFIAGLTVGVILIPQGMAYGLLAGLPPIYGLYAVVIAPIIYCVFGTSMQLNVGPVAITALLTASGVKNLGPQSEAQHIQAAIVLGFVSGLILIIMGLLRIGFVVEFLSNTVVSGFISASACIITISQLNDVLGVNASGDNAIEQFYDVLLSLPKTNWISLLGSLICLVALLGIKSVKKMPKWLPLELGLMLLGILISWLAHLDSMVHTVGRVPGGLPPFSVPQLSAFSFSTVAYQAFIIGVLSYIGSIALARAFAKAQETEIDTNRELIALGAAGLFGAFASGHPVSGSFSRTAINNEMGARTPLAGVISAIIVIICLLALTSIFEYLPKFVLASIVIVSVRKLFDYNEAIYLWKVNKLECAVLVTTFVFTTVLGIETGIIASILISLLMVLLRLSRPIMVPLGRVPNSIVYRNVLRHPQCITYPGISIFRIEAELYFANILRFKQHVLDIIKADPSLQAIIVDASSINFIDTTALRTILNLVEELEKKNISLVFANAHAALRELLATGGITPKLEISPKLQIHQVVQHFLQEKRPEVESVGVSLDQSEDLEALEK